MIPVLRPSCTDAEIAAVTAVLRSGWWGMGPQCAEFERRWAERTGRQHCVTTNSATAALHLTLLAYDIGPGDEVIVPALTFVSTALAVAYTGATPVFADVDPVTLCIDWRDVGQKLTAQTKAVIPVDFAGHPVRHYGAMAGRNFAASSAFGPIRVIQDAAHSAGGMTYGDATCYSFHPVKNLATGDGGAIVLDDADRAERLRRLRWCGIDKSTTDRTGTRYAWDYDIAEIGYKAHWNDIQAAIGLVQMDRLDALNARRRAIAARYTAMLADVCETPADHPAHTWHLYQIRVDAEVRPALIAALAEAGIAAGVHYRPAYHYKPFAGPPLPVTEREWQRCVSLPIFADLTDKEQGRVVAVVRGVLGGREAA